MDPLAPEEIRIHRQALTVLERVLRAPAPEEGCALLLGTFLSPQSWRLLRVWPCLNVWEPSSQRPCCFRVDPREQLLAQKWARDRGWNVLGAAHSHPASAPEPSARDLTLTFGPTLMLILGRAGDRWELACWWIPATDTVSQAEGNPPGRPDRLPWRMED